MLNNPSEYGVTVLTQPTSSSWAHLVSKTYCFSENQIEKFSENLKDQITKDFIPFKDKLLPFFLIELENEKIS